MTTSSPAIKSLSTPATSQQALGQAHMPLGLIWPLLNAYGFTTEALPKVKLKGRTASGWQIVPIPVAVG